MSDPSLEAELAELVRTVSKPHSDIPITGTSRFIEDLKVDSLDISMIIFSALDKYEIDARVDDLPPIKGIADLVAYVAEHRKTTAATTGDIDYRNTSNVEDSLEAGTPPVGSVLDADDHPPQLAEEVRRGSPARQRRPPVPARVIAALGRLKLRIQENGPVVGAAALPYARGMALLRWLTGRRWVLESLYGRQRTLVRQFLEALGYPHEPTEMIGLSAISNLWGNWGLAALAVMPTPEFDRWVGVSGFATFEEAHRAGARRHPSPCPLAGTYAHSVAAGAAGLPRYRHRGNGLVAAASNGTRPYQAPPFSQMRRSGEETATTGSPAKWPPAARPWRAAESL